jgi:plasmid stability protein
MANISVRKLNDKVVAKLRLRAAQHGVSMEEEVRRIIEEAVSAPTKVGDLALQIFGEAHGVELEPIPHTPHEPVDLP